MRKNCQKRTALVALVLLCILASGCGCGKKKEKDPEKEQVMKITITPEATPTPVPEQVNADAVVTRDKITMINGYLVEGIGTSGRQVERTETGEASEEPPEDNSEE